ncbi:hypothetical protein LTR08_008216 [Meristemomyces frigidus]|nr:hypothetical protein LTR08_008216 [Meristemomyces frigidus]
MARYPTFEEYEKKANYGDGVKRCDELLAKNQDDVQLLTTKFRLLNGFPNASRSEDAHAVFKQIESLMPANPDISDIVAIEDATVASRRLAYPPISTAGPIVAKMWEHAVKGTSSMDRKLELISTRWERAVYDSRVTDMQQTLIQLKALQPKNRVVYMAHAALTQMLSSSNEDLQARLALGLARKAVTERYDEDQSLDCRVSGQIFAMQRSEREFESIQDRRFEDSKQVFDALRAQSDGDANGGAKLQVVPDPKIVPANEWLSAEISELQLSFSHLVESKVQPETMKTFAANAIQLFGAATTSLAVGARRSPADACFVAVSALVYLFGQTNDTRYLLQAAYLADTLLRHNEHIHEARLILVYLYMRLGLGSLALRKFVSLEIKEIQFDTIGHVLFSRISLLHPLPTVLRRRDTTDPLKLTMNALNYYVRCESKLAETEVSVLGHGQTGMLFDLHELRDTLRQSLTRRTTLLEWRRTARLTKNQSDTHEALKQMGPEVTTNWVKVKDNRDFHAAFDYGYNVERALYGCEGVLPNEISTLFALTADTAWSIATESATLVDDTGSILSGLNNIKSGMENTMSTYEQASTLGMTAAEYLAGDLAFHVLGLLLFSVHGHDANARATKEGVESGFQHAISITRKALEQLSIESLVASNDSLAEHLYDHYAYADILRIIVVACTFSTKRAPQVSDELKQLQDQAKSFFKMLQRHAVEQQARIKVAKLQKSMQQDESILQALRLFDEGEMQYFCSEVADSAREGWEGVSNLKLA